ncbi:MAG: DUF2470 domain-containing protein [Hyphomicrobiaceae bacterium]
MTPEKNSSVLRPVDDDARRLAKTLLRTARHAALATLEPSDGSPAASRVALATTMSGAPVFLISRLSGHFTNLEADPRCSLLVGEPGKGDPLAHPRMTLIGNASRVADGEVRDRTKARYLMRHPKSGLYVDFGDFAFWRMEIARASLNAGFGKAFLLGASDVATDMAGLADLETAEASAAAHMNADHSDAVDRYAALAGEGGGGWRLACLDPEGLDLVRGDTTSRLWFDRPLRSANELRPKLVSLSRM